MPPDLTPGPWPERLIAATGWIGEHPGDGGDIAHLLVYPTGQGVAEEMRAAADLLGLRHALDGPLASVPADVARLTVVDGWVRLATPGGTALERPVSRGWAEVAAGRGCAVVTWGWEPYSGLPGDLDGYLADGRQLFMGLLTVGAP